MKISFYLKAINYIMKLHEALTRVHGSKYLNQVQDLRAYLCRGLLVITNRCTAHNLIGIQVSLSNNNNSNNGHQIHVEDPPKKMETGKLGSSLYKK